MTIPAPIKSRLGTDRGRLLDRGWPGDAFLEELISWGRVADEEIFLPNESYDVYSSVAPRLGPYLTLPYRRAVLLEVMRVLAGFESSWNWNEGRDTTNSTSVTPDTIEAGAWQVSANSIHFGPDLKALTLKHVGTTDGDAFQRVMKKDHVFAMEYIARLLRHTILHNGPVKRKEINPYLSPTAVNAFQSFFA